MLMMAQVVAACGCYPFTAVLDDYEKADIVLMPRLLSLEKATNPKPRFGGEISGATMMVERVYKGDLKVDDKLTLSQGDETLGCSWSFDRRTVGERYLLYLDKPEGPSDPWYISICNGSKLLEFAKGDLLYLNNIDKRRGSTRIYGVINPDGDLDLEGRRIRIIGKSRTYFATIDKDGVYELYDVPAGRYVLEPELPFGWKVEEFRLTVPPKWLEPERPSDRVAFILRPRRHFGIDIELALSNHVSGTILDANSKPLKSVCVSLAPASDESFLACNDFTDERGRFRINSVRAGQYVLILNYENKPTADMPFPKLYYPGVKERKKATTISVTHGENVTGLIAVLN
jgi:hypothetical protein